MDEIKNEFLESGTQQHDVDSTKVHDIIWVWIIKYANGLHKLRILESIIQPKYDDSIRIIVEEPDGLKKVCRVQRITYKNFLTMCEEVTKLEHKTTPQLLTPMLTKPPFCTPATR